MSDSEKIVENDRIVDRNSGTAESVDSSKQFNSAKRAPGTFRGPRRPKQCIYCVDSSKKIDYKDPLKLYRFVSDRSRILSRRVTGLCSHHQKKMSKVIKLCRNLSLMR